MTEPESDESLMLAYAHGDAGAFATLYQRHRNPLFGFLLRQTQDRARAEDLFQEVWGRLIQARARYEASAKFTTFLFHIAHNLLIDQSRRARPQAAAEETERVFAQLTDDEGEQPDNRLQRDEQQQRLLAAIAELPDDQRETFLLRAEEGLDVESIATVTGVGFETAKSRLRYALRKLKEALQP